MSDPSRRAFLIGGCVAAALAAAPRAALALRLPLLPGQPRAMPKHSAAPRSSCPHAGCRYNRQGAAGGLCGLGS